MGSCCGKGLVAQNPTLLHLETPPAAPPRVSPPVSFTYTGERALSARGAITGRVYRFSRAGEVVPVDARDAPGMSAVPSLRRVSARAG